MTINALSFFYDISLHWVTLKGRQGFLNSSALILPQYQILCAIKSIYTTPWPPLNNFQDPSFYLSSSPGMVRASWRWSQESMMISTKKSQGKLPRTLTRNLNQRIITGEELGFVTSRTKRIHTSTSLYLTPFRPILDVYCDWIILILEILMIFLMIKWMSMSPEIWKIPFHWKK